MRSEFEKLPQIESHLHNVVFDEGSNKYLTKKMGHLPFEFSEWFLNGSWLIYQHQQSKVNELQKRVDKAIRLLVEAELYQSEPNIDLAVQALKCSEE